MFFSYNILIAKNSSFAVIWKYMHDRRGVYKVQKRDLISIDINEACKDLIGYIPTGELLKSELRNKMSLYLLAQLSYGITLVFSVQADYLIADLQATIKSLIHVPEEKREKPPRKSTGTRKRKATELDDMVEAALAVPRGLEPEEMEEEGEEEEEGKRRRISTRKSSVLDLRDPRHYVDQQLPVRIGLEEQQLLMGDGGQLDDMFLDQTSHPLLPPPEWGAEQVPERLEQRRDSQKVSMVSILGGPEEESMLRDSQKVSMASILGGPEEESMLREVEQTETVTNVSELVEVQPMEIGGPGPELPVELEVMRQPIYRTDTEEMGKEVADQVLRDSLDRLQLDALPDLVIPPKAAVKKRKRLLVDEKTSFTNEQFLDRMQNYQDLLRTREQLRKEIAQPDLPSLSELLSPRPHHIKGLNAELYPLFDSIRADYREPSLTLEEAQRMTLEDFQNRRFDADALSWRSKSPSTQQQPEPIMEESLQQPGLTLEESLQIEQDRRATAEKVSIAMESLVPPAGEESLDQSREKRPSSALSGEAERRDTGDRRTGFSLEQQPLVQLEEEPIILQEPSGLEPQLAAEITADASLLQESVLSKEKEKGSPPIEEGWVDMEAQKLYSQVSKAATAVVRFDELFDKRKTTRAEVARKFFTILKLLKNRKVKVRQREPYGEILIRDLAKHREPSYEENL